MVAVSGQQIIRGHRAGFLRDIVAVSERALRSVVRDTETTVPALIIPVFMYVMTVGALEDFAKSIPGLDYRAFQLPVAVMFAVTGISRATTVVADIQSGYFDRLAMTPVNRLALLLGLMVADFTLVVALTIPVVIMGFIAGVGFVTGVLGILGFYADGWHLGAGFLWISLHYRFQNRQRGRSKHEFFAILSLSVYDLSIRSTGGHDRLAFYGRRLQPSYLWRARRTPLVNLWRVGRSSHARWGHLYRCRRHRKHQYDFGCPERPSNQKIVTDHPRFQMCGEPPLQESRPGRSARPSRQAGLPPRDVDEGIGTQLLSRSYP